MSNKDSLYQREEHYGKNVQKKALVKNYLKGLKYAGLFLVMLSAGVPVTHGAEIIKANNSYNRVVDYYNNGDMENAENATDEMARFIRNKKEKEAFSSMSQEEKLAYIEELITRWNKTEGILMPLGFAGITAALIMSKLADGEYFREDIELERFIYELYLDEKHRSELKEEFNKKEIEKIAENINANDPRYNREKAKETILKRSFADDVPIVYNDYVLGYKNGQYDFYSRCNYGSGNIYNKAIAYVKKGLSAEKINKRLIEVSYKKGYYRSAGIYVVEKLAKGKELSEEEKEIFDSMENLSLNNIMHIDRYSATEVKDRQSYWYGYLDGFKYEVTSNYSSIEYDLSDLEEDVRNVIENSLDTNSYKFAFYKGITDGIRDLHKRAELKAASKEEIINQ